MTRHARSPVTRAGRRRQYLNDQSSDARPGRGPSDHPHNAAFVVSDYQQNHHDRPEVKRGPAGAQQPPRAARHGRHGPELAVESERDPPPAESAEGGERLRERAAGQGRENRCGRDRDDGDQDAPPPTVALFTDLTDRLRWGGHRSSCFGRGGCARCCSRTRSQPRTARRVLQWAAPPRGLRAGIRVTSAPSRARSRRCRRVWAAMTRVCAGAAAGRVLGWLAAPTG